MAEFIYDEGIPGIILTEIKKNLEPWGWVLPLWCERVFVGYDDSESEYSAATNVEYAYRWARITFHPSFLKQDNAAKDALHELIHVSLAVVTQWAKELIKTLVSESDAPKFRQVLLEELTQRTEAATEDLASRISAQCSHNQK